MPGRKPTPSSIKKLRSTERPCRVNENEAEVVRIEKLPPSPSWFSNLAKRIYRRKGQELINQGIMSTLDIDMFLLYCNEYATYIETSEWIREIELDAEHDKAQVIRYKRVRQQNNQAWERCKSIAIEFGFTPSARSRVSAVGKQKELSDFEKLMQA